MGAIVRLGGDDPRGRQDGTRSGSRALGEIPDDAATIPARAHTVRSQVA